MWIQIQAYLFIQKPVLTRTRMCQVLRGNKAVKTDCPTKHCSGMLYSSEGELSKPVQQSVSFPLCRTQETLAQGSDFLGTKGGSMYDDKNVSSELMVLNSTDVISNHGPIIYQL